MCGRYYIETDERELQDIVNDVQRKISGAPEQMKLKTNGEVFPSDMVPVQTGDKRYEPMIWGFIGINGKPLINARSETAATKPTFKQSMLERRCLIPASGYYEWRKDGKNKIKYQFYLPGSLMFFAGCFRQEPGSHINRFVILTRQASKNIEWVHDRMPVIIPKSHIQTWLHETPTEIEYALQEFMCKAV